MKYLSFDLEATGLEENAQIIEFAMIPFCSKTRTFNEKLKKHYYIQCLTYEELLPHLNPWVAKNNKELIIKASNEGISLKEFKRDLEKYFESQEVQEYFGKEKITLFGKSISAIDLPFLNRDLGWDWMNKYFHHRNLDLSCFSKGLIDLNFLKKGMDSGNKMMNEFGMGEVSHTALEDAINTAKMYFLLLEKFSK